MLWVDPLRLAANGLVPDDVVGALREQNIQVPAGQIGQPPAPVGQSFQLPVSVLGRLSDIEQFEEIIVKTGEAGQITRLKDVARLELGAKGYEITSRLNGAPATLAEGAPLRAEVMV